MREALMSWGRLVCVLSLLIVSHANAVTTTLSVSLLDPTTLLLGNSQRDIAITNLYFTAALIPHYTGDAAGFDQNGFNFSISALEQGTMTYQPVCSGRGCKPPSRATATWTQGIYDPFTNTYSPIRSTSTDLFTPGDKLDATYNFVVPGGVTAAPVPFSFTIDLIDNILTSPYTFQLIDTITSSLVASTPGSYVLGPDSYAIKFSSTYDYGSGANINGVAAVPLPATFPLLLSGMGVFSFGMRRNRRFPSPRNPRLRFYR